MSTNKPPKSSSTMVHVEEPFRLFGHASGVQASAGGRYSAGRQSSAGGRGSARAVMFRMEGEPPPGLFCSEWRASLRASRPEIFPNRSLHDDAIRSNQSTNPHESARIPAIKTGTSFVTFVFIRGRFPHDSELPTADGADGSTIRENPRDLRSNYSAWAESFAPSLPAIG